MIVRGPFTLTWGGNTLADIESIDLEYDVDTDDYKANSGQVYEINKSIKASIKLTFLATDLASISAVLPQHFKAEGEQLGDGTFVFDERGALDIKPDDCDTEYIYNDLEIAACSEPNESFKLLHARTVIDGFEIGKIRKIVIKFVGEPGAGQSLIHLIGDQGEDDFFQLGDNDLFILGDNNNLVL